MREGEQGKFAWLSSLAVKRKSVIEKCLYSSSREKSQEGYIKRLFLPRELGNSCTMDADIYTHIQTYAQLVHVCVVKAEGKLLNLSKGLSIGADNMTIAPTPCVLTHTHIFSPTTL